MCQFLKCATCGEVFDIEEARQIANYVDDSGIVAFWTPACPFCGSEDVDEYYEMDEEEEDENNEG